MPTLVSSGSPSAASSAPSSKIQLRCYVYRCGPGMYEGECIDLDLIVPAKSSSKAVESLRSAIAGYLATVLGGDSAGLVPRPSPLLRRLKYYQR